MYIDEDANHSRRGFQIVLYTHESYTTSAKHAINDHFGWQVHLDEDNCVYLEKIKMMALNVVRINLMHKCGILLKENIQHGM